MQLLLEEAEKLGNLEEAISQRKSRRAFKRTKLTKKQLSRLIWSAGKAPSAGATYPLELYVVIGAECVESIAAGVYHCVSGYSQLE